MPAYRRGIIGESRNAARAKIMGFCIGDSRTFVAAYQFSYRGTARAFFHGIMHAAGHTEAHANKGYAYNEKDEDRPDDGKFNGRRASLVATHAGFDLSHD